MDDVVDYIKKRNRHSPVVRDVTILGLLFADDDCFFKLPDCSNLSLSLSLFFFFGVCVCVCVWTFGSSFGGVLSNL